MHTAHGSFQTPGFFAVATQATLKGMDLAAAEQAGVEAMICNSYHLHLSPGEAAVEAAGGLHRLMGWRRPLATDSGGFQVFSLRFGHVGDEIKGRRRLRGGTGGLEMVRLDERGADFRSYRDGGWRRITPEVSMVIQGRIGADIAFTFDECSPFNVPEAYTRQVAARNLRWARRCLEAHHDLGHDRHQALYGIVHGGIYPDLRAESAREIAAMGFAGFGIGDCLGDTKATWYWVLDQVRPHLPEARPRHLLGVGEPDDLIEGAIRGIDHFDCAMPTRLARHGTALVMDRPRFRFDLSQAECRHHDGPIDPGCGCRTCARYGRRYLNHLIRARETVAIGLIGEHNLHFVAKLTASIRDAISAGRLAELRAEVRSLQAAAASRKS